VLVGIETDRGTWVGTWVAALIAAGYTVYGINPLQVARYRERHCVPGAKSDAADAHTLADMVPHRFPPAAPAGHGQRPGARGEGGDAGAQDVDLPNVPVAPSGCASAQSHFPERFAQTTQVGKVFAQVVVHE